ncbi:MAG TPA: ATP-binding cassette domain-containing protein, partial [Alphaproteobacteria bacterium]|nr:ATP-binding cassette domain-containing protein [Alphaproteobacteria bacterium]
MPLVQAKSVTVKREETCVLDAVDVALEPGQLTLTLGANGAGKSTLARVLIGLETPSAGTITRSEDARIAYVPQASRRDPSLPLSAGDFLALSGDASPAQDDALSPLGVSQLLRRPLAALSGGELRRVLLARALRRRANLLVLDEPLAGVDAASQEPLYRLIARYTHENGIATLLIAHEVLSVLPLADRVLCLDTRLVA